MTAIYISPKETNINIGDVQKVVVEEIKKIRGVCSNCRTITIFTDEVI